MNLEEIMRMLEKYWNNLKEFCLGFYYGWISYHKDAYRHEGMFDFSICEDFYKCPRRNDRHLPYLSWCKFRECKAIRKCHKDEI